MAVAGRRGRTRCCARRWNCSATRKVLAADGGQGRSGSGERVGIAGRAAYLAGMGKTFDTEATIRELKAAGMDRRQAMAVAEACRKAAEAGESYPGLDAAIEEINGAIADIARAHRSLKWALVGAVVLVAIVTLL